MAFTTDELDFIEKNKDLIEQYPQARDELLKKAKKSYGEIIKLKLLLLIHYLKFGAKGFIIRENGGVGNRIVFGLFSYGKVDGNWEEILYVIKEFKNFESPVDESEFRKHFIYSLTNPAYKYFDGENRDPLPKEIAEDIGNNCVIDEFLFKIGRIGKENE